MAMATIYVKDTNEEPEPTSQAGEYVVLGGAFGVFYVTRMEGARVAECLARWFRPRWIEFEDTTGSLVRVRSRDVNEIYDLSPRIRDKVRAFRRAHWLEDNASRRSWEEDN